MHTIVRASCPECGDIEMGTSDLELRLCSAPQASIYLFTCPRCEEIVVKPASDERIVTLLSSVGVPTVHWDLPAELDEPHEGPEFTVDDLLDLHLMLERTDWFDRLQRIPTGS